MMNEIWKDIKNYEGLYQVSNFGNVKSLARITCQKKVLVEKYLTLFGKYNTYIRVHLVKNGKTVTPYVHRLVAEAFIDNPDNKSQVNHKDGIKSNNFLDNLEWVTASENQKHAINNGLHLPYPIRYGKENSRSIPILQFSLTGELLNEYDSATQASIITGVIRSGIVSACRGRIASSGNFIWLYKKNIDDNKKIICKSTRVKPIIQYDLDNNKINEFKGISNASKLTGIPSSSIHQVCNFKLKQAGGFIWRYKLS